MKWVIRGIIIVVLLSSSFDIGLGYVIRNDASGCDCVQIGTWSPGTLTCTLTGEVHEIIEIDSDCITLNGNGYSATGIFIKGNIGYTIKNFVGPSSINIYNEDYGHSDCGIITDNTITGVVDHHAIDIWGGNYIEITNNTISYCNNRGISLDVCSNISITDNTIYNNDRGIVCWDCSSYNNIINNTIYDNYRGIFLIGDGCENIEDNILNNNSCGIDLSAMTGGNTISNNTISNSNEGINIGNMVCESTIINNNISDNEYGIKMSSGIDDDHNNSIICNDIFNNNYGIHIQNHMNNSIYLNNLVDNTNNSYESLEIHSNQWYNNHWSDFDQTHEGCIDSDNDGICDLPYNIPGGTGIDMYPLVCIDWRDEWMGVNSDGGTAVTTIELQESIHHWLEDIPVRCHILSLEDIQEIIAIWLS